MKIRIHQFFSVLLAFFLLVSTTTWTVGKHYCMGLLVDYSFFSHAQDCGMGMESWGDNLLESDTHSCCKDQLVIVGGQDQLSPFFDTIHVDGQSFFVSFSTPTFNLSLRWASVPLPYEFYPPPLLIKDIQLLDEVFLI